MKACKRCNGPITDNRTFLKFDLNDHAICEDCNDKFKKWFAQAQNYNARYYGANVQTKSETTLICPNCKNTISIFGHIPNRITCNVCQQVITITKP
jgi:ribosomal protein S27E